MGGNIISPSDRTVTCAYCGAVLTSDLDVVMVETQPNKIYYVHRNEILDWWATNPE